MIGRHALLIAPLLLASPALAAEPAPGLAIRMSGFHSDDGQVLLSVYRGDDGFPGEPDRAWKRLVTRISDGRERRPPERAPRRLRDRRRPRRLIARDPHPRRPIARDPRPRPLTRRA